MKIREITILLLLMLASTFVLGQTNRDTLLNKTVLFKITDANSSKTSYLFGTHHAFGKLFFDSLTVANKALSSSDILIRENLDIPGHTAEEIINNRKEVLNWHRYLNQRDLTFLKNLFSKSPTDFNKMSPAEMYVFLNRHFKQQVCLNKSAVDTSLSLDDYISFKAHEQNIELYGLETIESQIELINKDVEGMPRRTHKRRLSNIIDKIRNENANECGETDWYSQMEIDFRLNEPCTNTLVLTDRNNTWIKTIRDLLKKKNCFIAVGLSHLMYQCGLINQLQGIGYSVTPINLL
ncbi:TraB/GumN family protein [Arenibacter sp. F20364]|uniref:TraB/GumN family protein n=1 Tax=Arenibacter sp. F20364 TaxID=2926415 RepID=UPI001FF124C0|nr:TraB/GumN family protein [Arenibacter sp. F20364]MCK0192503.1 TraB/GumN family protein [Arenibacter sp. F20364]